MLELENNSSQGHVEIRLPEFYTNIGEVLWRADSGASLIARCNCTSTAFAPHKHGGEKGIHMRLQVDTFEIISDDYFSSPTTKSHDHHLVKNEHDSSSSSSTSSSSSSSSSSLSNTSSTNNSLFDTTNTNNTTTTTNLLPSSSSYSSSSNKITARKHLASAFCRVQLFRLKGAQRKLKTDKSKIERLNPSDLRRRYQQSMRFTQLYNGQFDAIYSMVPMVNHHSGGGGGSGGINNSDYGGGDGMTMSTGAPMSLSSPNGDGSGGGGGGVIGGLVPCQQQDAPFSADTGYADFENDCVANSLMNEFLETSLTATSALINSSGSTPVTYNQIGYETPSHKLL